MKIFQGGISSGYKKYVTDNAMPDETYSEGGIALFRVQGSGPENMQAIQVEPVYVWSVFQHHPVAISYV